jgi:imidazolonepropionase-like amidohydrolase
MVETTWRLPATVLPEGDERPLWVTDGRLTEKPLNKGEALPGRFTLPGLVDAHAHLAVGRDRGLDAAAAMANLRVMRDAGVLVVRDVGAPKSITLELRPGPEDPTLLAAGRFHAREGRYYAPFYDPVEPADLIASARAEIARGATWIKVVADWRSPELSYDAELLQALVAVAHASGARVAAHSQWEVVRDVVAAGVDSIEHGFRLDRDTLAVMAAQGVAWTPTLKAVNSPVPADVPAPRRAFIEQAREDLRALVPIALGLGVTILAGTDTYGTLLDEIRWLIDYGLSPAQALGAASSSARAFLGVPTLEAGAVADVVTFDADPREDPSVLANPVAILVRGRRVK